MSDKYPPVVDIDILPPCYDHASPGLVRRLASAREHIDTWTWKELSTSEVERVQLEEVAAAAGETDDVPFRRLYRQPLTQVLPWEPCLIRLVVRAPVSKAEDELRQALVGGHSLSAEATALLNDLISKHERRIDGETLQRIRISFWSAPNHISLSYAEVLRHQSLRSCGMTEIGAQYRLSDFEPRPEDCYLAPWPKLFNCADAVIPDLRSVFAEILMPQAASVEVVTFSVIKAGTVQAAKWTEIYKNACSAPSKET